MCDVTDTRYDDGEAGITPARRRNGRRTDGGETTDVDEFRSAVEFSSDEEHRPGDIRVTVDQRRQLLAVSHTHYSIRHI